MGLYHQFQIAITFTSLILFIQIHIFNKFETIIENPVNPIPPGGVPFSPPLPTFVSISW